MPQAKSVDWSALVPERSGMCDSKKIVSSAQLNTFDELLKGLSPSLNVVGVTVKGEYGFISQSLSDRTILPYYARTGRWDELTNRLLIRFFATSGGGNYIDIGANIGLTTIPVAQNQAVNCLALEPEPSNFRYLRSNIAMNCPYPNVTTKQVAAFSSRRTIQLELSPDNLGDHRIRSSTLPGQLREHEWPVVDVDAWPLDELVSKSGLPLAIKIDTQGAEPFVVEGGEETIKRADLMIMEIWPYGISRAGGDPEVLSSVIREDFQRVAFREMEGTRISSTMSAQEAAVYIEEVMHRHCATAWFYLDAIAVKQGQTLD